MSFLSILFVLCSEKLSGAIFNFSAAPVSASSYSMLLRILIYPS